MSGQATLQRLFSYLAKYRRPYLFGYVAEILTEMASELTLAYLILGLTNATVGRDFGLLLRVSLFSTAVISFALIVLPIAIQRRKAAAEWAAVDLRQAVFQQINRLPQRQLEATHSGDLVSRLTNDVTAAKDAFGNILTQIGLTLTVSLACTVYMFALSWKMALVAFAFGLVPLLFNRATAKPLRSASAAVQSSLGGLNVRLKDLLAGISVIRAFQAEPSFVNEYTRANQQSLQSGYRRVWLQSLVTAGNDFSGGLGMIGLLVLASYFIITKQLTAGVAITAVQLTHNLVRPFQVLGDLWGQLQHSLAASDRLFAVIDAAPEVLPNLATPGEVRAGTAIELTDVCFHYEQREVISQISLTVPTGQVVALAGPSGGGKSTLCKLLLGLYPIDSGTITVQGRDLHSYDLEELRRQTAFVPQDAYLYAGTVGENIAFGKPGASQAEIEQAARAANAHDFIMALPQGYDTPVGERGTQLSGGQRQRISIARAILKDAPILLLDEATSSLDSEAEALVQEALTRLMAGRTTLIIAHRLATIRNADCIHVIAEGRVVESGTHDELLAREGVYRRLHEIQAQAA